MVIIFQVKASWGNKQARINLICFMKPHNSGISTGLSEGWRIKSVEFMSVDENFYEKEADAAWAIFLSFKKLYSHLSYLSLKNLITIVPNRTSKEAFYPKLN